jgi:hypothetical protein
MSYSVSVFARVLHTYTDTHVCAHSARARVRVCDTYSALQLPSKPNTDNYDYWCDEETGSWQVCVRCAALNPF